MTTQTSTGLNTKLLDTSPFKTIFNLGFIKYYGYNAAIADPATADAAIDTSTQYTLLATLSNNGGGTGLTFEAAATGASQAGTIAKKSSETWKCSGANVVTGTAKFFRLVAVGDDATLSTTQARVQGTCGTSYPADNIMESTALVNGVDLILPDFTFTIASLVP